MKSRVMGGCNEKDLVLFYYKELDARGMRRVQGHLDHCPDCSARLAALQRMLSELPTPEVALSPLETQRLSARISDRARQAGAPKYRWWGSALAAGAVLAISLWLVPGSGWFTGVPVQSDTEIGMLQEMELLQNLDLLENLDLLQELEHNA